MPAGVTVLAPAAGPGERASTDRVAFFREIPARIARDWPLKVFVAVVLLPVYNVPYFLIQYVPLRQSIPLEPTWLDRAVPFDPRWTWVYVSLYPFIPLTALVADGARRLFRYLVGMSMMALAASLCFALYPVAGPRPPLPADPGLYGLLVRIDTPLNAFPSLHVGLVVFPLLFGWSAFRGEVRRGADLFLLVLTGWGALICHSTLTTKQHYIVDVAAGAALAWACHVLSQRIGRTAAAVAPMGQES